MRILKVVTGLVLAVLSTCSFTALKISFLLLLDQYHAAQRLQWYAAMTVSLLVPELLEILRLFWETSFLTRRNIEEGPCWKAILLGLVLCVLEAAASTFLALEVAPFFPGFTLLMLLHAVLLVQLLADSWKTRKKAEVLASAEGWGKKTSTIYFILVGVGLYICILLGFLHVLLQMASILHAVALLVCSLFLGLVWCQPIRAFVFQRDAPDLRVRRLVNLLLTSVRAICTVGFTFVVVTLTSEVKVTSAPGLLWEGLLGLKVSSDLVRIVMVTAAVGWVSYAVTRLSGYFATTWSGIALPSLLSTIFASALFLLGCKHVLPWRHDDVMCPLNESSTVILALASVIWLLPVLVLRRNYFRPAPVLFRTEEELFVCPSYSLVCFDAHLLCNYCPGAVDSCEEEASAKKPTRVYMCTTMYREADYEMEQLLRSLSKLSQSGQLKERHVQLEAHIFLDNGVQELSLRHFALQLLSLVDTSLGVSRDCAKLFRAPYGLQLSFTLKSGLPLFLHLKDVECVKAKKRWSQVMYMRYILHHQLRPPVVQESLDTLTSVDTVACGATQFLEADWTVRWHGNDNKGGSKEERTSVNGRSESGESSDLGFDTGDDDSISSANFGSNSGSSGSNQFSENRDEGLHGNEDPRPIGNNPPRDDVGHFDSSSTSSDSNQFSKARDERLNGNEDSSPSSDQLHCNDNGHSCFDSATSSSSHFSENKNERPHETEDLCPRSNNLPCSDRNAEQGSKEAQNKSLDALTISSEHARSTVEELTATQATPPVVLVDSKFATEQENDEREDGITVSISCMDDFCSTTTATANMNTNEGEDTQEKQDMNCLQEPQPSQEDSVQQFKNLNHQEHQRPICHEDSLIQEHQAETHDRVKQYNSLLAVDQLDPKSCRSSYGDMSQLSTTSSTACLLSRQGSPRSSLRPPSAQSATSSYFSLVSADSSQALNNPAFVADDDLQICPKVVNPSGNPVDSDSRDTDHIENGSTTCSDDGIHFRARDSFRGLSNPAFVLNEGDGNSALTSLRTRQPNVPTPTEQLAHTNGIAREATPTTLSASLNTATEGEEQTTDTDACSVSVEADELGLYGPMTTDGIEDRTYILATDADMHFDEDSLLDLVDKCNEDLRLGACCGRTHPVGSKLNPIVWFQKFEYAKDFWMVKSTQNVIGCVMCCPGCFSLYRAKALAQVVHNYSEPTQKPGEVFTKDTGEDRWMCTLLMLQGWKLSYSAYSVNSTYCPDSLEEFLKQRRRWVLSDAANSLLVFQHLSSLVRNNACFSLAFVLYLLQLLFIFFLSPGTTIFLIAVGLDTLLHANYITCTAILSLLTILYGSLCTRLSAKAQISMTRVMVIVLGLAFTAIMIGLGVLAIKTVTTDFLWGNLDLRGYYVLVAMTMAVLYAAALHPSQSWLLVLGVFYVFYYPAMHLLLPVYSLCNIVDQSWGTRDNQKAKTSRIPCFPKLKIRKKKKKAGDGKEQDDADEETSEVTSEEIGPMSEEESDFWTGLVKTLVGREVNLGLEKAELAKSLRGLRLKALVVLLVVNVVWMVLLCVFYSMSLEGIDSLDAYGLMSGVLFGFNFLVQMVGMTVYRVSDCLLKIGKCVFRGDKPYHVKQREKS